MAIRLGIDTRKADQQVRGTVVLPKGTGRTVSVVFAQGDKAREATEAGADFVGAQDLVDEVNKGKTDFDVAIATPDMMGQVGKLGKVLGPQRLMPNPKTGTVTFSVGKAVTESKAGRVNYRADKFGIVHMPIGKRSFDTASLSENFNVLLGEILRVKPSAAKGRYIKGITLSSTMGPGLRVGSAQVERRCLSGSEAGNCHPPGERIARSRDCEQARRIGSGYPCRLPWIDGSGDDRSS